MFGSRSGHLFSSCSPKAMNASNINIMGQMQVQHHRTFSTSPNLKNHHQQQHRMSCDSNRDESRAKVVNSENNYPNNERKTSEDMGMGTMTSVTLEDLQPAGAAIIIATMRRTVSECPSEDSFIVFDGCGSDSDDVDSYCESDDDSNDDDLLEDQHQVLQKGILHCDDDKERCTYKKVHFPEEKHLKVVHHMIMWSFALRASRKGPWEECARDRARFLRRIECCREALSLILQHMHRARVYEERFAPLDDALLLTNRKHSIPSCSSDSEQDDHRRKHRHKRPNKRAKARKKRRRNRFKTQR